MRQRKKKEEEEEEEETYSQSAASFQNDLAENFFLRTKVVPPTIMEPTPKRAEEW